MKEEQNKKGTSASETIRFAVFAFFFSLAALAMLGRYAYIMLVDTETASSVSTRINVERGPILDRNGRILALQTKLGNVSMWRPESGNTPESAALLAPILGMSEQEIINRIELSGSDFIYLKKRIEQSSIRAIENLKDEGKLRGIGIEPVVGRIYPEKDLAAQLVGFVGDSNEGLAGIEYAFEDDLAPKDGSSIGRQVVLTIDTRVQHILEEIALDSYEENKAEAVIMLAMDPRNGDILGYVSMPDFDPNEFRTADELALLDRAAVWAYEPGSVFKVFSIAAIMDLGGISGQTSFSCNGYYEQITSLGEAVRINCLGAHGTVRAQEIITYSCNSGAAYASDQVTATAFYGVLHELGFGARTGAGVPGETAGYLRPVERWSARSKPTIAIGQEIAVSALQMMQAASAIANDGIMVKPRVVSRILGNDGSLVRSMQEVKAVRALKPETARALRQYMEVAASEAGTGRRAAVDDLSIGVKTGTAQLIDPETGRYSDTDFIASCMALLPSDEPSLVLYMVIIKPMGDSYLGGRIAAPPIREAAEALVDYLGIPRGRNPQALHSGSVHLQEEDELIIGNSMPDLGGYSKRQLLPLLFNDDLKVEIHGDGWVIKQTPPPGTPIKKGSIIILELE